MKVEQIKVFLKPDLPTITHRDLQIEVEKGNTIAFLTCSQSVGNSMIWMRLDKSDVEVMIQLFQETLKEMV